MGDNTAPVAGRATDEVASVGWAVRPLARAVRRDQIDPQRFGWRRPARHRRSRTHGAGSSTRATRRDAGAAVSTAGTSNAAKQSSPCAQVSIKRAVASDRAAMCRPPHGTRSRSSRSANAASVAFTSLSPRVEQLVSAERLMGFVSAGKRIAAFSHARRRGVAPTRQDARSCRRRSSRRPASARAHCDSSCACDEGVEGGVLGAQVRQQRSSPPRASVE